MVDVINKFGSMRGWNSVTVNILGRDLEGITAIKYNDSIEKENAYGAGKYPVGRMEKNYTAEASITLFKEEIDALQVSMAGGMRMQDILPFDIIVEYESARGVILKDRIRNCEFTDRSIEVKNGDGSISYEYKLIVSHIEWGVI